MKENKKYRTAAEALNRRQNREFTVDAIRAIEGEGNERKFQLSFSSEEPYTRWFGPEILDHSDGCVRMDRINSIGCALFNHDVDNVIAKVDKAWVENGRGNAEIEFDTDDKAETIYQKVAGGTLKGVSVGYVVYNYEQVKADGQSEDGRFKGPCVVAKDWEPLEISIVSVPADPTVGVNRECDDPDDPEKDDDKACGDDDKKGCGDPEKNKSDSSMFARLNIAKSQLQKNKVHFERS